MLAIFDAAVEIRCTIGMVVEQRFPPGNNLFVENVGDDDAGEEDDDDSENQPETWNFCQKGGQLLRRKKDERSLSLNSMTLSRIQTVKIRGSVKRSPRR